MTNNLSLKSIGIAVLPSGAILFISSIAIAVGDTFEDGVAIEYRRYFLKVSLTTLRDG